MKHLTFTALFALALAASLHGQRGATPPTGQPPAQPGGRGGGGRGRGGIAAMTLTSSAWQDGGTIPAKYTQVNGPSGEVSPPLSWSGAPESTQSFVLIVHDVDAAIGNGTDDMLHWMLWNIPAAVMALPEHVAAGPELPDKTRQISATGPSYRGPGALSAGPAHHYLFEVFALDQTIDVSAVGQSPPQTRAAVVAAMAGHIRGKGVLTGLFKR
jgi:Raf kinase inhibitor-like YbhB/YbcL family protein